MKRFVKCKWTIYVQSNPLSANEETRVPQYDEHYYVQARSTGMSSSLGVELILCAVVSLFFLSLSFERRKYVELESHRLPSDEVGF